MCGAARFKNTFLGVKFTDDTLLQILQGYPIHVFCVPPTGVRLMQAEIDFTALKNSRLKRCMSGGEPVVTSVSRCQCFACSLLIDAAKSPPMFCIVVAWYLNGCNMIHVQCRLIR